MEEISIYSYLDYREYLRDFLNKKKEDNPHFSQRVLLRQMKITSTGFLANILAGRSNLTIDQTAGMASIMGLNSRETRYFKNLVYFAKAKTLSEKNDFFRQLLSYRKGKIKFLKNSELTLFKHWYYVIIRELLNFYDFREDYEALARIIEPPVTPVQARKAVEDLEQMGLIRRNADGFYKQVDAVISTGDEVKSLHVANYQRDMFDLGRRALDAIKAEERDLSGLAVTVSDRSFALLKEEVQNFRKRILQIAADEQNPDRVVRCNFQIFPVSRKCKSGKGAAR
jgi:uncharacterized protein (TIGR02147 family)